MPAVELSPEELERALAMRPRVPLTAGEQAGLLEMLQWYLAKKEVIRQREERRASWMKRFPTIFGAISALLAISTAIYNFVWVSPK
jgi:putative copper export protein